MRQILCALVIAVASPALAQDGVTPPPVLPEMVVPEPRLPEPVFPDDALPGPVPKPSENEDVDLMQQGARLLLRGLMGELEPMFDGMGKALEDLQPALQDLIALVDDIRNYDAPRILDNGDILIPRRKGAPPPLALPPSSVPIPEGEIEL